MANPLCSNAFLLSTLLIGVVFVMLKVEEKVTKKLREKSEYIKICAASFIAIFLAIKFYKCPVEPEMDVLSGNPGF
tara:strand:+ start:237 stop:464 length:228 start_codon:yes stop_codon:yes gene_type:complete